MDQLRKLAGGMILAKSPPSRLRILVPFVYCAGIFILSSVPGELEQQGDLGYALWVDLSPLVQNILHVPVFAGLAWTWAWALHGWQERRPRRLALAFVFTVLYAALDEWHQLFVPDRTASLLDLILDLTGAGLGLLLFSRLGTPTRS